jgi:hypothetical protein
MENQFSKMTFPEQLSAYEAALAEVSRLKAQLREYSRKMIEAKRVDAFKAQAIEHETDIVAFRHDLEVAEARIKTLENKLNKDSQTFEILCLRETVAFKNDEIEEAKGLLGDGGDGTLKGRIESVLSKLHEHGAHSQPICNPPEATGKYVDVMGEMTIAFTVQLPVELCHEPVTCDDPAIEAALQAVSGRVCTYIWGEDKKPAVVYCDVSDQDVEIESDDRTSTVVTAGSNNDSS